MGTRHSEYQLLSNNGPVKHSGLLGQAGVAHTVQ